MGTTCKVEETTPGSPGETRERGQSGGKGEAGGDPDGGREQREEQARVRQEGRAGEKQVVPELHIGARAMAERVR